MLLAAIGLTAGACAKKSGLQVGLAYGIGGPGDDGFNDSALAGLDRVQKELAGSIASVKALTARPNETADDQYQRLTLLCESGYNPVIAVGYTYAGPDPQHGPLARAARDCPNTDFAIVDDGTVRQPNVANLVFSDQQGAYLMGVVAARKSGTHTIGLVGACDIPLIDRFVAGYRAGAQAIDPSIVVNTGYASEDPNECDFTDADAARDAAADLYAHGADVVFQVAGGAGIGVFEAAKAAGTLAIGVDQDQYLTVGPDLRPVIVTSMIKRVDTAVFTFVKSEAGGHFRSGPRWYDLGDGGLSYATSGGAIDALVPELDRYRQKIIDGQIKVPVKP